MQYTEQTLCKSFFYRNQGEKKYCEVTDELVTKRNKTLQTSNLTVVKSRVYFQRLLIFSFSHVKNTKVNNQEELVNQVSAEANKAASLSAESKNSSLEISMQKLSLTQYERLKIHELFIILYWPYEMTCDKFGQSESIRLNIVISSFRSGYI